MQYCASPYLFQRRQTREVTVGDPARGGVIIGGEHPVVMQSMLTCDTMDTKASVQQTLELVAVGCQIVRITAPTVKDAANLQNIVKELRDQGCFVPIVADIHFKPDAAMEAAKWVEKVRINPGNYADSKKFAIKEYTNEQYEAELQRIEERFTPLVKLCKDLGRAMRIGTNHGSLSDRIMNRFGDSPLGMVESALEFARIARKNDYHNFVFSMKSSNPKVMIECYRLLVARLNELGPDWNYPIHLGVTEAGEGEDGRIKSAIGIGSLLCDGLGDTIRVSLTEDSPNEIAVCRDLLAQIPSLSNRNATVAEIKPSYDPFTFQRRSTPEIELSETVKCGGEQTVRVVVTQATWDKVAPKIRPKDDVKPEGIYEDLNVFEVDPTTDFKINCETQLVTVKDGVALPAVTAFRLLAAKLKHLGLNNPILLKDCLNFPEAPWEPKIALLRASVVVGALLADGIGDAVLIRGESGGGQSLRLAYNILQAAGCRSFKTDYVACPSCGRTLFNLQTVTARIKARTDHLKGVKIAIMGCIVNGPGEMADADFGYVGGAPNKINLYVGKQPIKFNIPEAEAVDRLVDLIREHGKWVEPEP
ncbi:(E)-4-hydroxy-3-methylbut-2-enyl-diphosphate synthase [Pedosphaera parvula]|uniref:4-hydroxy-3-methylbut-2-en-1-yl diphosphate synthase (flavodoxin) n=1 Tax=Pedosphaera parvula (strain Ellin514) TaxID=320771 RepID=B9XS08_PEDPL|nr:(E)-4-hydroxy-3-methylbut-2-enyl-diphosphate synthase [Pedosphaera parvula]EEF57379.1 1-hydroxy-2-methyl-2-(E)-butenyl 4-diphosphate synthase [Pedosphaera parvula Ellin514]